MSLAIWSYAIAVAAQSDPPNAGDSAATRDFPKRLAISVVADERLLSTFQQRVSSWFSDGTEVRVTVTSEVDEQRLLTSSATEVRAWIIPLSAERALLTFSSVSAPAPPRYLVREIRLRQGFDEVGLERLAAVIHSAFVALREGVDGVPLDEAERALGKAGVTTGFQASPVDSIAPAPVAPKAPPVPSPKPQSISLDRSLRAPAPPAATLIVDGGYGLRIRGPEGIAHGPTLALGVQLQQARAAFDLQLSGQFLFRSAFDAPPFSASVQTTALRGQVGIEPRLGASLSGQALLGVGADLARISVSAEPDSSSVNARIVPRTDGTQWRAVGELTLGVLLKGTALDVGVYAQGSFTFEDVHYSAATSDGESLLLKPWRVQPAFGIHGRFRAGP